MQHTKSFRPKGVSGHGPFRQRSRRVGLDPAMAKAIARSEFGRFYVDDQQQREVQRSLERAKGRRQPAGSRDPGRRRKGACSCQAESKTKPKLWHQPSVRERRTEISDAMARIAKGAAQRKAKPQGDAD